MIPSVSIQKIDGGTGVVRPSSKGVCAIIAPSEKGPSVAEMFLRTDQALAEFGGGPLVECAAYLMPVAGNPALLVKGAGSTAADYGTFEPGAGNTGATVASEGTTATGPLDDYDVLITCTNGGTVGTPGIEYTRSLDGGVLTSAVQALGSDTTITIPDTGVAFDFTVDTMVAGNTYACKVTGPKNTNADLADALEALRVSSSPFEAVLYDGPADGATVDALEAWIAALELTGRFKVAICTARARDLANDETEAEYKTYLEGIFGAKASINVVVCADVGDVPSSIPGRATTAITQARPAGWAVAARAMQIPVGEDPAYVDRGPLAAFGIKDNKGSARYHDEYLHPGLDDLRLTTLRSFDAKQGTYINNALILSASGSDYVYLQHARCLNRACELAFEVLSGKLSKGLRKSATVGPNGERYIAEGEALQIEAVANGAIARELAGQVDEIKLTISRTDDISSNQGAVITAKLECVALAYVKRFSVSAGFVKAIAK